MLSIPEQKMQLGLAYLSSDFVLNTALVLWRSNSV